MSSVGLSTLTQEKQITGTCRMQKMLLVHHINPNSCFIFYDFNFSFRIPLLSQHFLEFFTNPKKKNLTPFDNSGEHPSRSL